MARKRKANNPRNRVLRNGMMQRNKLIGWAAISEVLQTHSARDATESDKNAILIPIHVVVERWRTGALTDSDYLSLNEFNAFGFCLSGMLYARGTEDTKRAVGPMSRIFDRVGEHLKDVGDRWADKGSYTPRADELQAYQTMLAQLDVLIDVADIGAIVEALRDAKRLCEGRLPGPEYQHLRSMLVAEKVIDRLVAA